MNHAILYLKKFLMWVRPFYIYTLIIIFVLTLGISTLTLYLQQKSLIRINKNLQEEIKKAKRKELTEGITLKYIDINTNLADYTFSESFDEYTHKSSVKVYFFNTKKLEIPLLLQQFDHIIVINHRSEQGITLAGSRFSSYSYNEGVSFETKNLIGDKYISDDNVIIASLIPKDTDKALIGTGIQIVAHNTQTFDQLIQIADSYKTNNYYLADSTGEVELPARNIKYPNYTHYKLPYKFYLPKGYLDATTIDGRGKRMIDNGFPNTYFEKSTGELICLAFKDDKHDPCGFSTSGCTCCNTGCELLDYAVYTSKEGIIRIEPVLQKGGSTTGGVRFLYDSPNPWIYYSASFSDTDNNTNEVLEFLYLIDSIERIY